ncbi:unnamed protein product, partial [Ectocarpus sp. 6 AP-2014]
MVRVHRGTGRSVSYMPTEYEDWSIEEQRTATMTNILTPDPSPPVCDAASPSTAEPFMLRTDQEVPLGAGGIVEC